MNTQTSIAPSTSVNTTSSVPENDCIVEILYGQDAEETALIRCFRDTILTRSAAGEAIIELYYTMNTIMLNEVQEDEAVRRELRQSLDLLLPFIRDLVLTRHNQ